VVAVLPAAELFAVASLNIWAKTEGCLFLDVCEEELFRLLLVSWFARVD